MLSNREIGRRLGRTTETPGNRYRRAIERLNESSPDDAADIRRYVALLNAESAEQRQRAKAATEKLANIERFGARS